MKKIKLIGIILTVIMVFAAFAGCWLYFNANEIGSELGNSTGQLAGQAIGSFKGITEGIPAGRENGKQQGLSAEDTYIESINSLSQIGRLEVLVAGAKLTNVHSIGTDYSAIYLVKGNAVYSVDLAKAQIDFSPDHTQVDIRIPEPEMQLYIDEAGTEKLAEYQKHFYSGTAHDGFTAYLNTTINTVEEVRKTMANYDELLTQAKDSAIRQIRHLAASVCAQDVDIRVSFIDRH